MIHDATVEVMCDSGGCRESVVFNPAYVYRNINEKFGYYDTSDKAIRGLLEAEGWTVTENGERTYCEGCSESENDDDNTND